MRLFNSRIFVLFVIAVVDLLLLQTSALLQAKAKEAQQQLQLAGKSLGNFGQKLMLGTTELFDQVKDAIQAEMAFDSRGDNRVASKRQLVNVSNTKFSRCEMPRCDCYYCIFLRFGFAEVSADRMSLVTLRGFSYLCMPGLF